MLLSIIVFSCLLLNVLPSAVIEQNTQYGKDYISKMDKKTLRILEGHTDNFQEVFDRMGEMVENSGQKLGLCTKFKEPISMQVSNLPGSFSTEELKWFEDTLETFINENIDELEDLEVHVIRQMEEKKRGDDENEDLLILIDIYGCYSDRFDSHVVNQKVNGKLEDAEEESGWDLEKKEKAAEVAVEQALKLKEEEDQKRLEEQKQLEEKQMEDQKKLEEKQKSHEQQLIKEQEKEQKALEQQQELESVEQKKEIVSKIVDKVKKGLEEKRIAEQLYEEKKQLEKKLKFEVEQLHEQQKEEKEKLKEEQRLEREKKKEAVAKIVEMVEEGIKQKKQKLEEASKELEEEKQKSNDEKDVVLNELDDAQKDIIKDKDLKDNVNVIIDTENVEDDDHNYYYDHDHDHKYTHSHTHSHSYASKDYPKELYMSGHAPSLSSYNAEQNSFASLPHDLRTKLQSVLNEQTLTVDFLPKLRHSPDPYFKNITRIQYMRDSFPKGFDETELQSYSEYTNYEGNSAMDNNDASSGPNMAIIQSFIVGGVLTMTLIVSVFY